MNPFVDFRREAGDLFDCGVVGSYRFKVTETTWSEYWPAVVPAPGRNENFLVSPNNDHAPSLSWVLYFQEFISWFTLSHGGVFCCVEPVAC